jgi:hypothetical protein
MSGMEHQEVNFARQENQDLVWELDSLGRHELAERFMKLFENRLCVYSESVRQIYTNYLLHFPSESGRRMVVLPTPYAFHDTLSGIESVAIRKTNLCVIPGVALGKEGLLLANMVKEGQRPGKTMPFKRALAQIISNMRQQGKVFLPILMKGDLREFNDQLPYIHLHCLELQRLQEISSFQREDIQRTITQKLLTLYREADSLGC